MASFEVPLDIPDVKIEQVETNIVKAIKNRTVE